MYMPDEVVYYLYKKILDSDEKKLTKNIVKNAVNIYGFKKVYYSRYIDNLKLFSLVEKKLIEKEGILSEKTIKFIYQK